MNRVFYIALTLAIVESPLGEGGFIRKVVAGVVGGKETPGSYSENSVGSYEDSWKRHGARGVDVYGVNPVQPYGNTNWQGGNQRHPSTTGITNWQSGNQRQPSTSGSTNWQINNQRHPSTTGNANWQVDSQRYPSTNRNATGQVNNQRYPSTTGSRPSQHNQNPNKGSTHRPTTQNGYGPTTGSNQGYKNTTAHIIDEDFLTSTENESFQHQQRPSSQYGGGGSYNKRPSTSKPYKNTTAHIEDGDYLTSTEHESLQHQQRPNSQYGGGGSYNKRPTQSLNRQQRPRVRPFYKRDTTSRASSSTRFGGGRNYKSTGGQGYSNGDNQGYRNTGYTNGGSLGYKSTSSHIADQDYLTSNDKESAEHRRRPTSGYGGGGTYNKRDTSSQNIFGDQLRPEETPRARGRLDLYKQKTVQIIKDVLSPNVNLSFLNRDKTNTSPIDSNNNKPEIQFPNSDAVTEDSEQSNKVQNAAANDNNNRPEEPIPKNEGEGLDQSGKVQNGTANDSSTQTEAPIPKSGTNGEGSNRGIDNNGQPEAPTPKSDAGAEISNHSSAAETPRNESNAEELGASLCVTLKSDSITCIYSNINDEKIENRKMRCNETDCKLEKNSEKSSLWICENIKCTVANVDFTQVDGKKKLMECTMDERSIITVQDKPIKCGPDEKEHNGRCRKVFGA